MDADTAVQLCLPVPQGCGISDVPPAPTRKKWVRLLPPLPNSPSNFWTFHDEINQNYCENIIVKAGGHEHMFQIASLYCKAASWEAGEMAKVMLDVAKTSLKIIANDLPNHA